MVEERTKTTEFGHGGRMSVQRKRDAVQRLLREKIAHLEAGKPWSRSATKG